MRALTVAELGFVSGGGTPLKQQEEQAAYDKIAQCMGDELWDTDTLLLALGGGFAAFLRYGKEVMAASPPGTQGYALTALIAGGVAYGLGTAVIAAFRSCVTPKLPPLPFTS